MSFENNFHKIITLYGGRQALSTLLGVGTSALSNYMKRGHMPARKFALLAEGPKAKRICPRSA